MPHRKLDADEDCPCESGKAYGDCCYDKDFDWVEDEDGNILRSVPMTEELRQVLGELRQSFIDEHGHEPGPDDLVLPDMPHPEHLEHMMVEDMKKAGIDPAIIYAYEQTGRLVTEDNRVLIPDKDLMAWDEAIEEYEQMERDDHESPQFPLGTVALYGLDDKTTTKIVAAVIKYEDADPILKRWVGTKIQGNRKVEQQMAAFFQAYDVKSVVMSEGNMGCPHEEGEDFPVGEDCPFCPFWKGKQGSKAEDD